ncbi:uncharacterized protein METZ01_LOCUS12599 [marine metagenome]|uniref:Uncharacterized protein n=1 Tax=marine metagenome TaxID=408172 RepID=A0A381NYN2_9ZZZZ
MATNQLFGGDTTAAGVDPAIDLF